MRSLVFAAIAAFSLPLAQPVVAQEGKLTIAYHSGPTTEVADLILPH